MVDKFKEGDKVVVIKDVPSTDNVIHVGARGYIKGKFDYGCYKLILPKNSYDPFHPWAVSENDIDFDRVQVGDRFKVIKKGIGIKVGSLGTITRLGVYGEDMKGHAASIDGRESSNCWVDEEDIEIIGREEESTEGHGKIGSKVDITDKVTAEVKVTASGGGEALVYLKDGKDYIGLFDRHGFHYMKPNQGYEVADGVLSAQEAMWFKVYKVKEKESPAKCCEEGTFEEGNRIIGGRPETEVVKEKIMEYARKVAPKDFSSFDTMADNIGQHHDTVWEKSGLELAEEEKLILVSRYGGPCDKPVFHLPLKIDQDTSKARVVVIRSGKSGDWIIYTDHYEDGEQTNCAPIEEEEETVAVAQKLAGWHSGFSYRTERLMPGVSLEEFAAKYGYKISGRDYGPEVNGGGF